MDNVILVEGVSDRAALEALAQRLGRDLAVEGTEVVPIGGAQAIGRALARYAGARMAGLCDAGEEADFRRALERAGLGENLDRSRLEALGFFVCDADLEEELIRALGAEAVLEVVASNGGLGALRAPPKRAGMGGRAGGGEARRGAGGGGRRRKRAPPPAP